MPIEPEKLDTLRRMLAGTGGTPEAGSPQEIGGALDFYLEHFADKPEFLAASGRVLPPSDVLSLLTGVLNEVGRMFLHNQTPVRSLDLYEWAGHDFYHGCCQIGVHVAAFIYFREDNVGGLGIVNLLDRRMKYSRFTLTKLPPGTHSPMRVSAVGSPLGGIGGGSPTVH